MMNRFSKWIVALVILLNTGFTGAVLYLFLRTNGQEPSVLIGAWFTFTTGELWMLSSITKTKVQGGDASADPESESPI